VVDRVRVFTFKDGLLARLAHDLRLHVERFSIRREGEQVHAEFDPDSLVIDGVMVGGRCDPDVLDRGDRAKIGETIRGTILDVARRRTIEFHGRVQAREDGGVRIDGELHLVGVRRPLGFVATRRGDRLIASVTLRPSEWGIAPYKALAGAIRLQDRVVVELDLDAAAHEPDKM
jgi:polyisoprenoid-binding protein YceI